MATTPNMNLVLPTVTVTLGPEWAELLNTALTRVDEHDHTSGLGKRITPAALNINGDLTVNTNHITDLKSVRFTDQAAVLAEPDDLRSVYAVAGDLYWNNGSGTPVQITSGNSVNVSTSGGIAGDYASSSAIVEYLNSDETYFFGVTSTTTAHLNAKTLKLGTPLRTSNGVFLKTQASMPASYDMTLPPSLPVSDKFLTIGSSGQVGADLWINTSEFEVVSNDINLKDDGIATAKIQDDAVTIDKIPDSAVPKLQVETFTSSGTFTPKADVAQVIVEGSGGGGGGAGGTQLVGGGGGGSGAPFVLASVTVTPSTPVTVTIGGAGAGGAAANSGSGGGTGAFGSIVFKPGSGGSAGAGGAGGSSRAMAASGGAGNASGSGTTGQGGSRFNGGPGGSTGIYNGGGGGSGAYNNGGVGGDGGDPSGTAGAAAAANSGSGGGGGGAGAAGGSVGGNGGSGKIIVTYVSRY